jgi:hypothetical protein
VGGRIEKPKKLVSTGFFSLLNECRVQFKKLKF